MIKTLKPSEPNYAIVSRAFKTVYKDVNIMTPSLLCYYRIGSLGVELTTGSGFTGKPIFGISVIDLEEEKPRRDLSTMCHSEREARDYIETLNFEHGHNQTI